MTGLSSYLLRIRKNTATQWSLDNPILQDGEPGYISDTNQYKIGDGVTEWTSLPIATGSPGAQGDPGVGSYVREGLYSAPPAELVAGEFLYDETFNGGIGQMFYKTQEDVLVAINIGPEGPEGPAGDISAVAAHRFGHLVPSNYWDTSYNTNRSSETKDSEDPTYSEVKSSAGFTQIQFNYGSISVPGKGRWKISGAIETTAEATLTGVTWAQQTSTGAKPGSGVSGAIQDTNSSGAVVIASGPQVFDVYTPHPTEPAYQAFPVLNIELAAAGSYTVKYIRVEWLEESFVSGGSIDGDLSINGSLSVNGIVLPSNVPAARISRTTPQTITSGTGDQRVDFTNFDMLRGGMAADSDGVVVPTDGVYLFSLVSRLYRWSELSLPGNGHFAMTIDNGVAVWGNMNQATSNHRESFAYPMMAAYVTAGTRFGVYISPMYTTGDQMRFENLHLSVVRIGG